MHLSYYETFHNFVSLKHTIYFAGCNSQYINTASFCRLVPDALQTFSASPMYEPINAGIIQKHSYYFIGYQLPCFNTDSFTYFLPDDVLIFSTGLLKLKGPQTDEKKIYSIKVLTFFNYS